MNGIIEKAKIYVKNYFADDSTGHDYAHSMRVYRTAVKLAKEENADLFTVSLAALLHDVDDRKFSPETAENKKNARAFMKDSGIDEITVQKICDIIEEISFRGSDSVIPCSIEGKCVQDADRLDAIGAIGIGRAFCYGAVHNRSMYDPAVPPRTDMNGEEYYSSRSTTINHFYEKLFKLSDMMNTTSAKRIAKQRDGFMRGFVDEFIAEWEE